MHVFIRQVGYTFSLKHSDLLQRFFTDSCNIYCYRLTVFKVIQDKCKMGLSTFISKTFSEEQIFFQSNKYSKQSEFFVFQEVVRKKNLQ